MIRYGQLWTSVEPHWQESERTVRARPRKGKRAPELRQRPYTARRQDTVTPEEVAALMRIWGRAI